MQFYFSIALPLCDTFPSSIAQPIQLPLWLCSIALVVLHGFGCVAWSFRDVPDLHHAYSMQAIAWSIDAC